MTTCPEASLVAAALRRQAFDACDAHHYDECAGYLERARELDPEGETPEHELLRERAARARTQ
jgi:hypothetical protein